MTTPPLKLQRDLDQKHLDGCYEDHYYDYLCTTYDAPLQAAAILLNNITGKGDGGHVLDVGCGQGQLCKFLKKERRYYGFDASSVAVGRARADYEEGERRFEVGRIESHSVNERFEAIMFGNVLHCIVAFEDHIKFLNTYINLYHPHHFVLYELQRFDPRIVKEQPGWTCVYERDFYVDDPKVNKTKRERRVMLFEVKYQGAA